MNLKRLDHDMSHDWHVAIIRFHNGKIGTPDWRGWMYEAKVLADEVPRMVNLFKAEREKTLPVTHRQCSHAPKEPVQSNHLRCCLGVECRACPELLALDKIEHCTPEQIDQAKAWTCAAHVVSEGGDRAGEGYLLTVDDRMFWDRVYESMSGGAGAPVMTERERAEQYAGWIRSTNPTEAQIIEQYVAFAREERARAYEEAAYYLEYKASGPIPPDAIDHMKDCAKHLREDGGQR